MQQMALGLGSSFTGIGAQRSSSLSGSYLDSLGTCFGIIPHPCGIMDLEVEVANHTVHFWCDNLAVVLLSKGYKDQQQF